MRAWSLRDAVWQPLGGEGAVFVNGAIKARFDTSRFVRNCFTRRKKLCISWLERLTCDQPSSVRSPDCLENDDLVFVGIEVGHRSGEICYFRLMLQDPVLTRGASLLILVVNRLRGNTLWTHQCCS